jgi:TDG/mug DNA glycosylase family protein
MDTGDDQQSTQLDTTAEMGPAYDFPTLPDLLFPGMDLVFVGINPSLYSVERGHYFARRTSRFWPAFSRSRLSTAARQALELDTLGSENDRDLLQFGIGFTDVVKIPSNNASAIMPATYAEWVPRLLERLARAAPRLAVFHGVTGYRPFLRHALDVDRKAVVLGSQPETIGRTYLYVVPNPSPANAHFTPDDQIAWYDRVANFLNSLE